MSTTKRKPKPTRPPAPKPAPPPTRSPFAVAADGGKYVELTAVCHPMVAVVDGLRITQFSGDDKYYLSLGDAIAWVEKEMQHRDRAKYAQALVVLRRFEQQPA